MHYFARALPLRPALRSERRDGVVALLDGRAHLLGVLAVAFSMVFTIFFTIRKFFIVFSFLFLEKR